MFHNISKRSFKLKQVCVFKFFLVTIVGFTKIINHQWICRHFRLFRIIRSRLYCLHLKWWKNSFYWWGIYVLSCANWPLSYLLKQTKAIFVLQLDKLILFSTGLFWLRLLRFHRNDHELLQMWVPLCLVCQDFKPKQELR